MRTSLMLLPLLIAASPAAAQTAPAAQLPPELTDPATAAKLADMMQALSKSFMNLPAGELQAIAEGRKPSAKEKRMTVRDMGRADNKNFDRDFQQQIAHSGPMMQAGMKALGQALPSMMQGMEQAGEALERAATNMPSPTYPKR